MNRNNCCVEMVKVPEVERCCWCVPLRPGIIIFGYINVILSAMVIGCLIVLTELRRVDQDPNFEDMTSTVLYSIFGMSVILNILLLVAGHQKDEAMLRLYSYYAVATTMAALIPTSMLMHRYLFVDVGAAIFTIAMQCYVIVLVRSEVLKLEKQRLQLTPDPRRRCDEEIDTPDTEVLLETTFH